ncbi:MAG: DNA polymerase/3'-5' exonuclease PolX [Patescibacteria group bacterium]
MINQQIAKIFEDIADLLEMKDVAFKPRAYRRAAFAISSLSEDVAEIYKKGGLPALEEIPGVGKNLALHIEEFIKTGKIKGFEQLKKKMPVAVSELVSIEGIGPKIIKKLYQHLKIRNLKDLEKAARGHKIQKIKGLGPKAEKNILQRLLAVKVRPNRFLLGDVLPEAQEIKLALQKFLHIKKEVEIAGSIRRGKETIGDIDILAIADQPKKIIDFFVKLPQVKKIIAKGETKGAVILNSGIDCDLRVLKPESYGAALLYFTGSKAHNIKLRQLALKHNWKLSEYGLFAGKKMIAGRTEREVYDKLKLQYIEPELREDTGEIEAASKNTLPHLVETRDIKGLFHVHSEWSFGDGHDKIIDIAHVCQKMGMKYVVISDHVGTLAIAGGMKEKDLLRQKKEIDRLNAGLKNFKILWSAEVNILKNGELDVRDEILEKMDLVIASVHSAFRMPKQEMTERIIRAMKNKNVDIIAHPTGRLILKREPYEVDLTKIIRAAREYKVALEINAQPIRLDLRDVDIKMAVDAGVKLAIGPDAHHLDDLRYFEFGVLTCRRGWAQKADILNTWPAEKVKEWLAKK